MGRQKTYDYDLISMMQGDMLNQALTAVAKTANRRLRRLEESNIPEALEFAYRYARELYGNDRPRYPTAKQIEKMNNFQKKVLLRNMQKFMQAGSSTISGIRYAQSAVVRAYREKGYDIRDTDSFYAFLNSNEFKRLKGIADSKIIVEDYLQRMEDAEDSEYIYAAYNDFLNHGQNMTFNQIRRRRNNAKWQLRKRK